MTTIPRVRRMVMFKHGVAYLERGGAADGPFELGFKRDEMNDVLKSLAVWVADGDARASSISFESPEDPEEALAAKGLAIAQGRALSDLVRALRGRRVRLRVGSDAIEGDVVGIEETAGGMAPPRRVLALRNREGAIALVDVASILELAPIDDGARASLAFLVDRSRAATDREGKTVKIALSGPAKDVRVAYVIPSPVWRVSYRLVRDATSAVLMAWGIVHNPADEDLEQIELTLTTGQPVSFVIDLYKPKRVARVTVEEKERGGVAPAQFERARAAAPPPPGAPPPAPAPAAPMMRAAPAMAAAMAASTEVAAEAGDRGELFEYRLAHPVDVKRGGSAMVPLLVANLRAEKERIWREGRGETPDLILRFSNDTGAVLEEGAAVVYDEGSYAGEAMLPYSPRGTEVRVAFAKDLGVRCRRETSQSTVVSGVRIGVGTLIEEQRREAKSVLFAESDHGEEVDVVFEIARIAHRETSPEFAQPFEETASFRRFRAKVPPRAKVEVVFVERWVEQRHVRYEQIAARELASWMENRFLDRAAFDALSNVLAAWAHAKSLDEQRARTEREQQEAYAKQQKIAEQLGVLKEGGQEGALRLRYVKELEREQDKVNACEAEVKRLRDAAEQARQYAQQALSALVSQRTGS